jgi:predicted dienelactone hydrolase
MLRPMDRRLVLGPLVLVSSACHGELDATLDVLPERYPNRLDPGDEVVSAVVFSPPGAFAPPRDGQAIARVPDAQGGEVVGSLALRDVDGDGRRDAIARFDVAELRAAGLLRAPHGIEVLVQGTDATWRGNDRLFDSEAALVVLPAPSGAFDVGTAELLVFDASRPGNGHEGRALALRLWYPAAESERQPAPYFLDERQAEQNLLASPLPLPDDLYAATHGFARQYVAAAEAEPHPALILSTEWGAPVETYAALAEDFASHGYLVFGIHHPNGSGVVIYPDGSRPELDTSSVVPDEANNLDWALDIQHVARWLQNTPSAVAARASGDERAEGNVRAALDSLDRSRIAALGHSFGGAAAVRADAESSAIAASANLDGAFVGDAASFAASARALVLQSPEHSEFDSSIDTFFSAAGPDCLGLTIDDTLHSNFGDTSWLYARVLGVYPDLTREGYQLGAIDPDRAHAIITTYARAFFESALGGARAPGLELPNPDYPEVSSFR